MRLRNSALSAVLIAALISPFSPSANAAPLTGVGIVTSNLLMYYDYRNYNSYPGTGTTVTDASGNGNTGTLFNSPVYTHSASDGYIAYSATSSQYQSVPTFTSDFSSGFSISFRADFGGVNTWERIIDFGNGSASSNILIGRAANSNDLWFETYASSANNTASSLGSCKLTSGIANYTVSTWTIVISANGGSCAIYKDGVAQTVVFSGTDISPVDNVSRTSNYIARSNWSADSYFEGKIYNVAVYNKALNSAEATQNYNSMNDTAAPTITSTMLSSPENRTSVETLTASETAYYTLITGGDSARVSLTSNGVLTFYTAPNFEVPTDTNTDNQYGFNVRVMDSNGNWTETYVQITVTNVAEIGSVTPPSLGASPRKGITVTITVTPTSGVPGVVTYLIAGKRIPGCYKKSFSGSGNSTCTWRPSIMGFRELTVNFTPTSSEWSAATSKQSYWILKRSTNR